jgi:hypothetical protein
MKIRNYATLKKIVDATLKGKPADFDGRNCRTLAREGYLTVRRKGARVVEAIPTDIGFDAVALKRRQTATDSIT